MRKTVLLTIFTILSVLLYAQVSGTKQSETYLEENLFLNGVLTSYYTGDILLGVYIKASTNGKTVAQGKTNGNGEFEMVLEYDNEYRVDFVKGGYITKTILISTVGVPENKKRQCPDMVVEITLFKPSECIPENIMPQAIGKAIYFSKKNRIDWDMNYSGSKIQALNQKLDACAEQLVKAEEEKIKKEKEYLATMKTANKAFTKKDWQTALANYETAKNILPEKTEPQQKIDLINTEITKKAEAEKQRAEELARAAAEKIALAEVKAAEQKANEERIAKEKATTLAQEKEAEEMKQKELAALAVKKAKEEHLAKVKAEALAQQKAKEQAEQEALASIAAKKAKTEKAAKEKAIAEQLALSNKKEKEVAEKEATAKKVAEQQELKKEKIALTKAKEMEKGKLLAQKEATTRASAEQAALIEKEVAQQVADKEKIAKETAAAKALIAENERKANNQKIVETNQKIEQQIKIAELKAEEVNPTLNKTSSSDIKGRSSIKIKRKNPTRHLYKKPNKYKKGKGPKVKKRMVF